MIYKLVYKDDGCFDGFYLEEFHNVISEQHININQELWQELLTKQYKLKTTSGLSKSKVYSMNDLYLFEEYTIEQPDVPEEPNINDRVEVLEKENNELKERLEVTQSALDELLINIMEV